MATTNTHEEIIFPDSLCRDYIYLYDIGSGANGIVFAAMRKMDDLVVAIKVFHEDSVMQWMPDANSLSIPMEIYITKTFSPSYNRIIHYVDHIYYNKWYYLITRLHGAKWIVKQTDGTAPIIGRDLWCFINSENDVCEADIKQIFQRIACAVQFLHDRRLCHGDIKDIVRHYFFFSHLLL